MTHHHNRTITDWGSLCLAVLDGREKLEDAVRVLAEAAGRPVPKADQGDDISRLLKFADALRAPLDVRRTLGELDKATAASKAAVKAALDEQTKLKLAQAALDDVRAKHEREMTAKSAVVEAAARKREQEANELHAKAAAVLKQAEVHAADLAAMKAKLARKIQLIESAA